jgi:quercetin 2,3-dioxygenase
MIIVIKSEDRRYFDAKDQLTWKTFDDENKTDPTRHSFGVLKILNEEIFSPGGGFILHTKKNMVVVTYVREGVIVYKSYKEEPIKLETKEFGRNNSEKDTNQYAFNTSESEEAHIFQCGFNLGECVGAKEDDGPKPKVFKKLFTHAERQGVLRLIASSDGRDESLSIQQNVQIFSTFAGKGNHIIHGIKPGQSAWVHVVKGEVLLHDKTLKTGDGAGFTQESSLSFTAKCPTELLLFDLCECVLETKVPSNSTKLEAIEAK